MPRYPVSIRWRGIGALGHASGGYWLVVHSRVSLRLSLTSWPGIPELEHNSPHRVSAAIMMGRRDWLVPGSGGQIWAVHPKIAGETQRCPGHPFRIWDATPARCGIHHDHTRFLGCFRQAVVPLGWAGARRRHSRWLLACASREHCCTRDPRHQRRRGPVLRPGRERPRPYWTDAAARPALDVDGVLNPYGTVTCPAGFTEVDLFPGEEPVRLCPAHGLWITELRHVFDVAWATAWNDDANRLLAPLLGIAALPVVTMPPPPFQPCDKIPRSPGSPGSPRRLDRRPPPAEARTWATGRPEPTLLIPVQPAVGLTRRAVDQALGWARQA